MADGVVTGADAGLPGVPLLAIDDEVGDAAEGASYPHPDVRLTTVVPTQTPTAVRANLRRS
jgi:hypothetical protein